VLVIDLDPQGNASTALGVEHHAGVPSTYDLLVEAVRWRRGDRPARTSSASIVVPATIDLAGAEIELVSVVAREQRLHKALQPTPDQRRAVEARGRTGSTTSSSTARRRWGCSRSTRWSPARR
jgi:cellulose biosynthesis protein BcsQ